MFSLEKCGVTSGKDTASSCGSSVRSVREDRYAPFCMCPSWNTSIYTCPLGSNEKRDRHQFAYVYWS